MMRSTIVIYGTTCASLCANLLGLWVYSGVVRGRGKVAINPEDGARFGAPVSETDPPSVARILRAQRNAEATIYPFLFLGLVFALAGGVAIVAAPIFATFTIARFAHSAFYLRAVQPWRTASFVISLAATFALFAATILALWTT